MLGLRRFGPASTAALLQREPPVYRPIPNDHSYNLQNLYAFQLTFSGVAVMVAALGQHPAERRRFAATSRRFRSLPDDDRGHAE